MTDTVVWQLAALQVVTRLEHASDDPARIRAAQDRIDWALRRTPHDMGESRSPGDRLWFEDVLGVYYTVDDVNMQVEVLFAGPTRRR
jgi:hypothetical protein